MDQTLSSSQNIHDRVEWNLFSTQELCEATGIPLSTLTEDVNAEDPFEDGNLLHCKRTTQTHSTPAEDASGSGIVPLVNHDNFSSAEHPAAVTNHDSQASFSEDAECKDLEASSPRVMKTKRSKSKWKSEIEKMKRMKGQEYLGYQKVIGDNQKIRKTRSRREMGPPCLSKNCKRTKLRACGEFPHLVRNEIFEDFWNNMDWKAKKAYVRSLVDHQNPKYPRKTAQRDKRSVTNFYYLKLAGVRRPVCKSLFLNTLGLKETQLRYWLSSTVNVNQKGGLKKSSHSADKISFAKEFLGSLAKLPSHYCRAGTSKFFLEPNFANKSDVYNQYKTSSIANAKPCLCRNAFLSIFSELNYSLYQRKKDQCDICVSYDIGNGDPESYKNHRLKMELARSEKSKDKAGALSGKCHVIAMDVQGVMLAPSLTASSLYYKTKLVVHNFTVYNLKTRHTTCYLWDETEGELVASVFATCLENYLDLHFNDKLPIIIYSDGCTYQNRNAVLSNALLHLAMRTKKTITQKYLEKGHTQMEVDSVHATIQRKLKGRAINHPRDYIRICEEARSKPEPYDVKYVLHSEFKNFADIKLHRYASIRPGTKAGDPQVTDIRQLQYLSDGTIRYKLDHSTSMWSQLPRGPKAVISPNFEALYTGRIPISKRKYQDLQDLIPVICSEHHEYYKNLPYKP